MKSYTVRTVHGRQYIYAEHGYEGKKRISCYLGPLGGYVAAAGVKGAPIMDLSGERVEEVADYLQAVVYRLLRAVQRAPRPEDRVGPLRRLVGELEVLEAEVQRLKRRIADELRVCEELAQG